MKYWVGAAAAILLPLLSSSRAQSTGVEQGPVLTLDDAIGIAEQNAFSLKTAASNTEIAHQKVVAARAVFGPQISSNLSFSYIIGHSNFGGAANLVGTTAGTTGLTTATTGATAGGTGSLGAIDEFANSQSGALSISLPIDISGTIRYGVRAAQASYLASKANFAEADNDLRLSVRQAYFQILQDKAQISVSTETVTNAKQTLTNAQQKLAAGTLARYDVLQYETQLSQAQSDLITAQNNLEVAKENFNNILARPIETPFDTADVASLPSVNDTADALVAQALSHRPDLLADEKSVESLRLTARATEASMDPSLAIGATQERLFFPGGTATEFSENSAFANLTIPIWDSGITRAHVKEARQQMVQAQIDLNQLKLSIALEVRQDLSDLTSAHTKLDVAQKQVNQAEEQYRLAVVRANAGEGTTLDVTNAQTQLTTARTGLVNARYAYLIAYASLQRAIDQDGAKTPPIVPPVAGKYK